MTAPQERKQWFSRRVAIQATVLCIATALFAYLGTNRSFRYSDSITLLDVTVCTDEGLLSINVPMVLRSPRHNTSNRWITYSRGLMGWGAPGGQRKHSLRDFISFREAAQASCEGWMFAGFGYRMGPWQSASRPGPCLWAFVPIWFATLAIFALFITLWNRRKRIRWLPILVATPCIALAFAVLLLRADQ
jgi:hypothetical protein